MDISIQTRKLLEELFDEKLKPVFTNINDVRGKLDEVIHSMDFLSSQYDVIQQKFTKFEELSKETNKENQRLKNEVSRLAIKVQEQRDIANDLEQYIRHDCLEIKGIPQREGENTDSLVKHLANELGVVVKYEDISISHRLPTSYSTNDKIRTR
jgi:predicted nuclease with TOPRIM domain